MNTKMVFTTSALVLFVGFGTAFVDLALFAQVPAAAQSDSLNPRGAPSSSSTVINPNFEGVDPRIVVDVIQRTVASRPKSEFETTAAYQERVRALPPVEIYPGITLMSDLALMLNPSSDKPIALGQDVSHSYDADGQVMTVNVQLGRRKIAGLGVVSDFLLTDSYQNNGSYIGENAYGATTEVYNARVSSVGIAVDDDTWLTARAGKLPFDSSSLSIQIPMGTLEAQSVSPHLRALLICDLIYPWLLKTSNASAATFSEPVNLLQDYTYLHVAPRELWIFDDQSGKVLSKISPESIREKQAAVAVEDASYPLHMEISTPTSRFAFISYQCDDEPETFGSIRQGFGKPAVDLPLKLRAKKRIVIRVRSQSDFPYIRQNMVFQVNGMVQRARWKEEKNKAAGTFVAAATF